MYSLGRSTEPLLFLFIADFRKRNEPLNFKEKLKQSLMEVQKKAAAGKLDLDQLTSDNPSLCEYNM